MESNVKLYELIFFQRGNDEDTKPLHFSVTAFLETVSLIIDENQFYQRKPFVFAPHEGTYEKCIHKHTKSRCRAVLRVVLVGGLDVFEQFYCD